MNVSTFAASAPRVNRMSKASNLTNVPVQSSLVDASTAGSSPLVVMRGITKAYPGVLANDAVNLTIGEGSIHALLGENGAGKSTLVKVLYGLLKPDAGSISWRGEQVSIASPAMARKLGIAMVFQHFSLFDSLSVLENIALGIGIKANDKLRSRIVDVSKRYGLPLDPDRSVYTLSVGARQRIEIVRCLLQEPRLLIMDEPTSVLTPQEVADLFATLRQLANSGMAILYISHKLEEIRVLCHGATILRGGRKVAELVPEEQSVASLAALMMGGELPAALRRSAIVAGEPLFTIKQLSLPAKDANDVTLHDINLHVGKGEIVGIAGVAGNGQDELLATISGERLAMDATHILFDETPVGRQGAGARRRLGLCSVPEERLGHAAVPNLSLIDNVFLTAHHRKPLMRGGLTSHKRSKALANDIIKQFNVQCHGPSALASSLSGGNLQKFIVGREILQSPRVLVISQPTWGVDAGAAAAIHRALATLAANGAAVLLISQDLDELMQYCDRIGALCAGRISSFYPSSQLTIQQVGLLMAGEKLDAMQADLVVADEGDHPMQADLAAADKGDHP